MNTPTSTPERKNVTPKAEGQTGKRARESPLRTPTDKGEKKPARTAPPPPCMRPLMPALRPTQAMPMGPRPSQP